MIYPEDYEIKIGFDRIREQTAKLCITARARELLSETAFSSSYDAIVEKLSQVDEMRTILMMEPGFPSDGYVDMNGFLRKLALVGAFLDPEEMLALRRGLGAVGELSAFFSNRDESAYPDLRKLLEGVNSFPEIVSGIDSIIDRFGKVKDNASPELHAIRRSISEREGQVQRRLNQLLKEGQSSGVIDQDASISIREGRAVIPVSASNKRKIKGLIHDESATGKTFYVEPMEVVELNNELRELEYRQRRETVRILTVFTESLRPHGDDIEAAGEYLAAIDFIRAKARFALANECVRPIIVDRPHIGLHTARHPLLVQTLAKEGRNVVPLDMTLTGEKHILVISGPNAGGKSVCLKTVGLLQYMLQCGFPVSVSENSEMGVFDSIFVDIGDEQSIDNDLSTYSSHLVNMKNMLRLADSHSLVLIDEFGTGTEPVMGGAIAEAVLEQLEAKRVFGVVTTHYSNLKYYASNAHGIINGAMSFDVKNIKPLFKLETGKPGSSFAIEIARSIGLPEQIIRSASEKAGSDHVNIERQLRQIARDKRYWEEKRDRIRIAEKHAGELAEKYEKELEQLKADRGRVVKEAREKARQVLDETNRLVEATIREIRESQAEKEATRLSRKKLEEFRDTLTEDDEESLRIDAKMERLRQRERKRAERKPGPKDEKHSSDTSIPVKKGFEAGDKVRLTGQDVMGEIISVSESKAVVGFGQIMTTVPFARLEHVSNNEFRRSLKEARARSSFQSGYDTSRRRLDFKQQIDLRGERVADAMEAVREFVDEAVMLGIPDIKILHGKGTGALKQEIRKYLSTLDFVESATDEDEKFGGAGITVVKLDI